MPQTDPWAEFADAPADVVAAFADAQPGPKPDEAYRAELTRLIQAQAPRADIDALIRGQGIDPAAVTGIDEALAGVRAGRPFAVTTEGVQAGAETLGQSLYRGVGDLVEGAGDVPGLLANPVGAGMNWAADKLGFGRPFSEDVGASLRDVIGAPEAVTDAERYGSAAAQGLGSAVATYGAARPLTRAAGTLGKVAGVLTGAPGADLAAGVTGGFLAEAGGDIGGAIAGPSGQVVGSLLGGLVGGVGGAV